MYLKSIRAHGFKSFADNINIEMQPGITAVVGPNGSGKSNIVDAVRWVLGCQSIKDLRGTDTMKDVIFNGSSSRKGLNRASVTLTFDNNDSYLKSEFKEVEVKRVVYKTGENEYYINNTKVRLKDITDLFLDTGAGVDSFNIISQGSVADVINSKAENRRIIFEEAAGTLKYKKRKQESLKKLEKTQDNILKMDLLINELSESVEPLKEQSIIAKKYLELKEELKTREISIISNDITEINNKYEILKKEIELLKKEELELSSTNTTDTSKIEVLKLKNLRLEEDINEKNTKLLKLTEELSNLASEKQIALERQKYEVDENDLATKLLSLKEEELALKKQLDNLSSDIISLKEELKEETNTYNEIESELKECREKKSSLSKEIDTTNAKLSSLNNKKNNLETNLTNKNKLPYAVSSILNSNIDGIHRTLGNIITYDDDLKLALTTVLGASSNFIIVDDESVTNKCIEYLKINKLGRATFFPLNVIEARKIDDTSLNKIQNIDGFIGVASNLVKYNNLYDNIVKNQLGNVLVVNNIDTLNQVGKLINYKYRVVSIEGEILHAGGSVTGGSNTDNTYRDKKELDQVKKEIEVNKITHSSLEEEYDKIVNKIDVLEEKQNIQTKVIINLRESLEVKMHNSNTIEQNYKNKINEIDGISDLKDNTLDKKIVALMEKHSKVSSEKDALEKEISKLKITKSDLNNEISEYELESKKFNSAYNKILNDLKQKEIEESKYNVRLDNLLLTLNEEYNMTYEKANSEYSLDEDVMLTRTRVNKIKQELNNMGEVNTGAIAEYERVSTRYDFLLTQKEDLLNSANSLTEAIADMDKIMIERFKETFTKIKEEFQIVFKKLFKGGIGELNLTDPDDILNTGIDIIAQPPGKKLSNIGLLSGGEKTLTAISLLFAILNVKTVPYCILDEVEAALDEANVEGFCKYLNEKKQNSQFILITHKKKTMEYADVLYGITMQESGVSKLVSVKLEENDF